jgi:hypothetical protein
VTALAPAEPTRWNEERIQGDRQTDRWVRWERAPSADQRGQESDALRMRLLHPASGGLFMSVIAGLAVWAMSG